MKNLFKKSLKYAFSVVPVAAIFLIVNFKAEDFNSASHLQPTSKKASATNPPGNKFAGLPCGFVSKNKQLPEKPTFGTNNYVPILQYPAGVFPGTNVQIPSSIYSEQKNDVLELQVDGNLVIYCLTCNLRKAIWSSQTNGKDGKTLFFQADGDLVLKNTQGKVVWHSNIHSTCAGSDQAYFTLQDDGNLAMLFNEANGVADYLGGSGSTNDQAKMGHPGKIQ